jgi:hypothetical protein
MLLTPPTRCPARWPARATLVLAAFSALANTAAAAGAAPKELTRLHALLVIDSNSSIKDDVTVDQHRMEGLLTGGIPPDRLDLTTYAGDRATPENILQYYRNLNTNSSEALLFFFAGHGATDPQQGHYLAMEPSRGKARFLTRTELRQVMQEKQAGLVVILTDCCSNVVPLPPPPPGIPLREPSPKESAEIAPVIRCLLFQQRGVVDITAATNEEAWGDSLEGGVFTRTLARLLQSQVKDLDRDRDGFVTWKEFYPSLEKATHDAFEDWAAAARRGGADVPRTAAQTPRSYRLLPAAALGRESSYAVVSLTNRTQTLVRFRYRWAGEEAWKDDELQPNLATTLFQPLATPSGPPPLLELQPERGARTFKLEARRWDGPGTPGYNCGERYSLRSTP